MTDFIYYNDEIRCYINGKVERFWRNKYWKIVENIGNCKEGYNRIEINKKMIYRHRIIAYCFLELQNIVGNQNGIDLIDHIDGDKLNNSVENLRITNQSGNQQNHKNAKGFYFNKRLNKYQAQIRVNGKTIYLGYFDTKEEAHNAYLDAKNIYHII